MMKLHFIRVLILFTVVTFGLGEFGRATAQDAQATDRKPKVAKAKDAGRKNAGKANASKAGTEQIKSDKVEVYKKIDDVELNAYIYLPEGHQPTDRRAAVVFFFGGGWTGGSPTQFVEHCKHLASKGMVAITVDYRVASRHGVKAISCVKDAKSAIRWTRQNAAKLGIDPDRIVAGGGSAGGHLAACTGVIEGLDESNEDLSISSRPNAMALFNPAVVLADIEGEGLTKSQQVRIEGITERAGVDPKTISPIHHVGENEPPAIIFHGQADSTVPYFTVEKFTEAMRVAGAECELVGFEGAEHGFFNYGRGDGSAYKQTLVKLDQFLQRLGYIE